MKLKNINLDFKNGFTMIELVIVIAVLGILAAFALPRFANFGSTSNQAVAKSMVGNLNASLGIVKAKFISKGAIGNTVDLDGNASTTNDIIAVTPVGDLDMTTIITDELCNTLVNKLLNNRNGFNVGRGPGPQNTCRIYSNNSNDIYLFSTTAFAVGNEDVDWEY